MNRIIIVCLLLLVSMPGWSSASVIGPARVSAVFGDILFRTPDSGEWLPGAVNTPLDEGDAVWCPDGSRVEVQLPDGTFARLDGGSQLDLLANEDGFVHLHLARGRLYLRTAPASRDNALQIDADDTTVLPSARTRLRIDLLPDNMEDVAITKGSAYVEGNGSRTRVRAGQHILLEDGYNELLPLNPPDSWELWNTERDREQARAARGESYLPEELRVYSAELDSSGSWVQVPEYGMVWRPTVIVSSDWAPYRSGRWIWKGDDYVWLSYEPWGWAPYHYGRWAVVSGYGWCWVPPTRGDVYWGPGYVGWYRTGSQVAWTPLAPGETFYGRRDYGRHSVNITTVNVNTTTVVYRNRSHAGGLTVMPHKDFVKGRPPARQPGRHQSVPATVSVGGPQIKPTRETRMPVVKQTPPRVAPPQPAHRDARELRTRFPRVTPTATGTVPPATRPERLPQAGENRRNQPVVAPGERPAAPTRHQQQERQHRDERRQTSNPAPSAPQVATPPPSNRPAAVPGDPRQHGEQPRPAPTVVDDGRNREPRGETRRGVPATPAAPATPAIPAAPGARQNPAVRPTPVQPATPAIPAARPAPATRAAAPAPAAVPQQPAPAARDMSQKKVWKVTTPEAAGEKDGKGENRGRDNRQR